MIVTKQIADLLTGFRLGLAFLLPAVGAVFGSGSLPLAVWIMIGSWTTDLLDGPLARRSSRQYHTWLGDHDLAVDITVATGLLVYLLQTRLLAIPLGAVYVLAWGVAFRFFGIPRPLGMLVQAPIYAAFICIGLNQAYNPSYWMLVWIAAVVVLTWPRFTKEIVPGFLDGMGSLANRR